MAMTGDDFQFLRKLHRATNDRPLPPDDPFRVPIHETLDRNDPVVVLANHILLAEDPTLQLFSGFAGSGKTTELFRLRKRLSDQGCVVLYADAQEYLNQDEPLTIADMLLVIAGGFSDAFEDITGIAPLAQSYWDRVKRFIRRVEVRLDKVDASLKVSSPGKAVLGGVEAGVNIKAELKTGSDFRFRLQEFLGSYLAELQRDVEDFIGGAVTAIHNQRSDVPVVFILDQLEKISGNYRNWDAVIRGAQQVFTTHLERLRLPHVHCIYSVPAWLILAGRPPGMTMLPAVHLSSRGREHARYDPGWDVFHSVVEKRFGRDGIERLFGPGGGEKDGPVERLIGACGGHVRDLLDMLREVLARANALPVDEDVVTRVIDNRRNQFLPIARDDARMLHGISTSQQIEHDNRDALTIERLSYFLNSHMAVYYENGTQWYDIHPLIREVVTRLATAGPNG